MMLLYGVFVADALKAKGVPASELRILRDQVRAIVEAQGDLVQALAALDREIEARGEEPGTKAGSKGGAALPASYTQRFMIQLSGVDLTDEEVKRIEKRFGEVAQEEFARIDRRPELAATPISDMKIWGGMGGATAGMIFSMRF
ncbi:MAG: hypothetical protein HXY30_17925 [Pseudorhodoplanes sp.]|nr:hypothetical protein [Pseudorhodoplanes sp.]